MPQLIPAAALAGAAVALATLGFTVAPPAQNASHRPPVASAVTAPVRTGVAPTGPALLVAPPPPPSNQLSLEGGGLTLPVGLYADCTRATEVGHDGAYIDGCIPRPLAYFIGHNPGPFTPMANVAVGQVVDYYDGGGNRHRLQIVSAREWNRFWGAPPLTQPDVVAQFQTCLTLDAVWDRILDAVAIPNPPPPAPVVPTLAEYRSA